LNESGETTEETATKERNVQLGGLYCGRCFCQGVAPSATYCQQCGRRFLTPAELAAVQADAERTEFDRTLERLRGVEPQRLRLWLVGGVLTAVAAPAVFLFASSVRRRNSSSGTPPAPSVGGDSPCALPAEYCVGGSREHEMPPLQTTDAPATPLPAVAYQPPPAPARQITTCPECHGTAKCEQCHGRGERLATDWRSGQPTGTANCVTCGGTGQCYLCGGAGRVIVGPTCAQCGGTGYAGASTCWRCSGSGQVNGANELDSLSSGIQTCPTCNGRGQIPDTCTVCGGRGRSYYRLDTRF
jgi:hypothetical protein